MDSRVLQELKRAYVSEGGEKTGNILPASLAKRLLAPGLVFIAGTIAIGASFYFKAGSLTCVVLFACGVMLMVVVVGFGMETGFLTRAEKARFEKFNAFLTEAKEYFQFFIPWRDDTRYCDVHKQMCDRMRKYLSNIGEDIADIERCKGYMDSKKMLAYHETSRKDLKCGCEWGIRYGFLPPETKWTDFIPAPAKAEQPSEQAKA